jgi:hypothetical protein
VNRRSIHRLSIARAWIALPGLLVGGVAPSARAQVFDAEYSGAIGGSFGSSAARVGDVDGDGCDDLVIGEPDWSTFQQGRAVIYSGKTHAQITYFYGNSASRTGAAVDGKIDADGDGHPDVLIGAPDDSTAGNHAGAVHVFSPYRNLWLYPLYGSAANARFGTSVRALQDDVDGDGTGDFIVGAPGIDTVYVLSGVDGHVLYTKAGQSGSSFGFSVSRAGNLDGDGIVDFVIGSPDYVDASGNVTGRVSAFAGKDGSKLWSVDGAADSKFGFALANPGDLDGDSFGDVAVGAPHHLDPNGVQTGCVTVLSGQAHSVLYKVFGDTLDDGFGRSVRGAAGDIDDDGTDDFIVGAPQLASTDVGYARTISGATGAVLFTYTKHTSPGKPKSDYGVAVAGGDFDGDGRTDVLIGGNLFDGGDGLAETWLTAVANTSHYGAGWAGSLGVPTLTAQSPPVVGQNLAVDLSNSAGVPTPGVLLIGVAQESILTNKGGTLLVDLLLLVPLSIPAAGITLSGSVPNDPALYGFHADLQGLELDAGATKGMSFTRGLDLEFGFP